MGDQLAMSQLINAKTSIRRIESKMQKYMQTQDYSFLNGAPPPKGKELGMSTTASYKSPAYCQAPLSLAYSKLQPLDLNQFSSMPSKPFCYTPSTKTLFMGTTSSKYSRSPESRAEYLGRSIANYTSSQVALDKPTFGKKWVEHYWNREKRPELSVYDWSRGLYPLGERLAVLNEHYPAHSVSVNLGFGRQPERMQQCLEDIRHLSRQASKLESVSKSIQKPAMPKSPPKVKKPISKAKRKGILKKTTTITGEKSIFPPKKVKLVARLSKALSEKSKKRSPSDSPKTTRATDKKLARSLIPQIAKATEEDLAPVKDEIRNRSSKEASKLLDAKSKQKTTKKVNESKSRVPTNKSLAPQSIKRAHSTTALSQTPSHSQKKQRQNLKDQFEQSSVRPASPAKDKKAKIPSEGRAKASHQDKIARLLRRKMHEPIKNFREVFGD